MSTTLIFWVMMLLWLVFGLLWWGWPTGPHATYWPIGNGLFLFILFLLLGWRVFGAPIHG